MNSIDRKITNENNLLKSYRKFRISPLPLERPWRGLQVRLKGYLIEIIPVVCHRD